MLHLFTLNGRIKRLTFWEGLLAWFLLNTLLLMMEIAFVSTPVYGTRVVPVTLPDFLFKNLGDNEHVAFSWLTSGMVFVQWVLALYILAAICAKRWHDLNYPGWLAVVNLAPVACAGLTVLAFLGGIDRLMIHKLLVDPRAGMFAIISGGLGDYSAHYLTFQKLTSYPLPLLSFVVVAGSFLYLGLGKGSKGTNSYGKSAV